MLLVTAAALTLFWLCDYWLFQLGPPRNVVPRLWLYAALVSLAILTTWQAEKHSITFLHLIESPLSLVGLFVYHTTAAMTCFGVRRFARYDLAWLAAMVPPPIAWALCAKTVAISELNLSETAKAIPVCLIGAAWIASMVFCVLRSRRFKMAFDDVDYVVNLAGWINGFGASLVVFAISPAALDSLRRAVKALTGP